MRSLLPLVLLLPFALACGKGFSDTNGTNNDGGPIHPGDDDDEDGGAPDGASPDGGCSGIIPPLGCLDCNDDPTPAMCIDGAWQCPAFACPIELDAGPDACASLSPIVCAGSPACTFTVSCFEGVWSCVPDGVCEYDGGFDAWVPPPVDAGPPPFSCGSLACDPGSSFCEIMTGGPVTEDGGTTSFSCQPLPSICAGNAGQSPCDCMVEPIGCGCLFENDDMVVTCVLP